MRMDINKLTAALTFVLSVVALAQPASAHLNPTLGRWMQEDPIGRSNEWLSLHGGRYFDGLNSYSYERLRPIVKLDPSGTFTCPGHCWQSGGVTVTCKGWPIFNKIIADKVMQGVKSSLGPYCSDLPNCCYPGDPVRHPDGDIIFGKNNDIPIILPFDWPDSGWLLSLPMPNSFVCEITGDVSIATVYPDINPCCK
jgi:hypothetical protein